MNRHERRKKSRSRETGNQAGWQESAALYLSIQWDKGMVKRGSRTDGGENGSGGWFPGAAFSRMGESEMTLFSCFRNNDYLCADDCGHRVKIKVLRRSEVRSDLLFLQFLSIFCPIYKILELHLLESIPITHWYTMVLWCKMMGHLLNIYKSLPNFIKGMLSLLSVAHFVFFVL